MSEKQIVFSAVQPTGELHLGNYLGALKNFTALQDDYSCIFCVADLHALTQWETIAKKGFDKLKDDIYWTTAVFLACGIDAKKHIVFNQSFVGAHAQLAWILICVSRFGWLNRMTQFKEKTIGAVDKSSAGLWAYPVLMAADILVYKAQAVPIGEDQKQHLELARDIADKFNNDVGCDFFSLPQPIIPKESARVMSLRDGTKKMSKSEPSAMSRINLTDSADEITKKIKKAKSDTDSLPDSVLELQTRAEADNLIGLVAALSGQTKEKTLSSFAGGNFKTLKETLIELLIETICPIGEKINIFYNDKAELDIILRNGTERADIISTKNLDEIRSLLGLV